MMVSNLFQKGLAIPKVSHSNILDKKMGTKVPVFRNTYIKEKMGNLKYRGMWGWVIML